MKINISHAMHLIYEPHAEVIFIVIYLFIYLQIQKNVMKVVSQVLALSWCSQEYIMYVNSLRPRSKHICIMFVKYCNCYKYVYMWSIIQSISLDIILLSHVNSIKDNSTRREVKIYIIYYYICTAEWQQISAEKSWKVWNIIAYNNDNLSFKCCISCP